MLRFPDLSRHSPTLVGGRRRIGLTPYPWT
jgi:hypothetical protein